METTPSPLDPLTWLRAICEALPGVEEVVAWGHPNFRVVGRTFVVFEIYKGRPSIAVKAELEEQDFLVEKFGLYKTPYTGKQGWVSAWVDEPFSLDVLRDLITNAHRSTSLSPTRQAKRPISPSKPKFPGKTSTPRTKRVP